MRLILIPFFLFCVAKVYAQPKLLPYYTAFESNAEKAGWQNVRKGINHPLTWGASTINGNTYIYHDYPVEGDTNVVQDWYISPPLQITSGTMLSFSCKVYSITGSATPSDEFSVWVGKGTPDPANGTYIKVADMTPWVSASGSLWQDTLDMPLPLTDDTAFIAFKYRATNNWFTAAFDSVLVSRFHAGMKEQNTHGITVFPNPVTDQLRVSAPHPWETLYVYGADGKVLFRSNISAATCNIDASDWLKGLYFIRAQGLKGDFHTTILKQ